jgi:hypothetical protein
MNAVKGESNVNFAGKTAIRSTKIMISSLGVESQGSAGDPPYRNLYSTPKGRVALDKREGSVKGHPALPSVGCILALALSNTANFTPRATH